MGSRDIAVSRRVQCGATRLEREQAIGRSSSIKNTRREGAPYLTAALEDTLICMHARDAMGIPHANQFRLRSDCGDDATAAYLLQNWMQHL